MLTGVGWPSARGLALRAAGCGPLCLHTAVALWTAGCVGSCDRIETGLVLCPHEPLCHLRVSPLGRTVISGTLLLVSHIPSPYMVPERPSPVATRPCPHVATADRSLGREKKVARRVASRSLQASGCPESEVAVGLGGAPWGIRQALAGAVTPGAPD